MPKSIKWHPNPSQIDQNDAQERSASDLGSRSAQCNSTGNFLKPFWWLLLGAKGIPKSSILAPGSIKSRENDVQEEVFRKAWKIIGISNTLWRPIGRCWEPFGLPLGAKGSQNGAFWHQEALKVGQNGVQEEVLGKAVKIIRICIEKCRLWRCEINDFSLFIQ